MRRTLRLALLPALVVWTAEAQAPTDHVPMGAGAVIVQTLAFEGGDRESVHRVRQTSGQGLHYEWTLEEVHAGRDTSRAQLRYLEGWADLADSRRLRLFQDAKAPEAHPGYTMHALSRTTYRRLRAGQSDSLQVMAMDPVETVGKVLGFGGGGSRPVRWRGTISPATPGSIPIPVLLNGRRVRLPTLHVRGDFTARQGRWQPEFWVLADSTYPLILKWIGAFQEAGNILQTTRIDLPLAHVTVDLIVDGEGDLTGGGDGLLLADVAALAIDGVRGAAGGGGSDGLGPPAAASGGAPAVGAGAAALERELKARCRVELPGIYFAFNSATLDPASDRAIATLAGILARHPDWRATLEGHTDSIGSAAANRVLSERRVEAVRARLVETHKLDPARLRLAGLGAAQPRESNATIEGRARNRRVELVRDC